MPYEHIFFDLDNTLWDLDKNSAESLTDLIKKFHLLQGATFTAEEFIDFYKTTNEHLWDLYSNDKISRQSLKYDRFRITLNHFNILDDGLSEILSNEYSVTTPKKTHLIPFSLEILNYLKPKYKLHILSNGFEEIQLVKLVCSGIKEFFESLTIPESCGFKKPHKGIFDYALKISGASKENSLMIGDDWGPDVLGAINFGMEAIYLNRNKTELPNKSQKEILCLSELKAIL